MHYLNPATLFGKTFQLPLDVKTIQREKKKVMAELELTGGDGLELNGRQFTKNDLIDYFDELQQDQIAARHLAVSEDPVLLTFLQDATIRPGARFKDAEYYSDPDFLDWVSPYFRSAFARLVTACFAQTDSITMRTILSNKALMTAHDKEQSWLFIAAILDKNIAFFEHYQGRGRKNSPAMMDIARISASVGHGYIEVIRQLPGSRFAQLKDKYAFAMQHPAIAVFNRDQLNRPLAVIWVEEAIALAESPQVKARIQAKLNELNNLLKKGKRKKSFRLTYWIILGAIAILGAIFDNDNSSSNTFTIPVSSSDSVTPSSSQPYIAPNDSVIVRPNHEDSTREK